MVEVRMKKLLKIPAIVKPPPPEKIIGNLNWVSGDDVLIEYIKVQTRFTAFSFVHSSNTKYIMCIQ